MLKIHILNIFGQFRVQNVGIESINPYKNAYYIDLKSIILILLQPINLYQNCDKLTYKNQKNGPQNEKTHETGKKSFMLRVFFQSQKN